MLQWNTLARTLWGNIGKFENLQKALSDLPIPLTVVRMYDILCWTTWKWDVLNKLQTIKWVPSGSGYVKQVGVVSETLLDKSLLERIMPSTTSSLMQQKKLLTKSSDDSNCSEISTLPEFDSAISEGSGFVVILDSTGSRTLHKPSCKRISRKHFEEKVVINKKKNGSYFLCRDHVQASSRFRSKDCTWCFR